MTDLALKIATEKIDQAIRSAEGRMVASAGVGREWPTLDARAFHGLAGEIVRAIEPDTEADPAALLVQILTMFGVAIGRTAHVRVEGDRHYANINTLVIGPTSKARKGTSLGRVRQLFIALPNHPRSVSGLSSGEGLKYAVRDALGDCDSGVEDKRLLVVESEFAQALRVASRAGNTLSVTIREAWDSGHLATLTKNDPIEATNAHIGIIGHITIDELRAELTQTDRANGFANRFLFVLARRSKTLPFGGKTLPEASIAEFSSRLATMLDRGMQVGEVGFDDGARDIWIAAYPLLSEGHSGMLGAVTARAEAQVLRLALLYAQLDGVRSITSEHLTAAIAVWEYAEASAGFIFGSALGDPIADAILRALRANGSQGMTRTQIRDLFQRNQSSERIGAALKLISGANLASCECRDTDGRSMEVWTARGTTKTTYTTEGCTQ